MGEQKCVVLSNNFSFSFFLKEYINTICSITYIRYVSMIDILIIIWLLIFFMLTAIHLSQNSITWGAIAGIWLIIFGLVIIATGVQVQSGQQYSDFGTSDMSIEYTYTDYSLPWSTYSIIWGIPLVLTGVYMLYANILTSKKRQ